MFWYTQILNAVSTVFFSILKSEKVHSPPCTDVTKRVLYVGLYIPFNFAK